MNTLILSCNTGEGHNACARAIREYYELMGETCEIRDALAFVSEEISRLVAKGHVLIYRRFSSVFGWGYEYAQRHRDSFDEDSRLYHFFARGTESLYQYIAENNFNKIICTHPFAALMVTELRHRCGLKVDTAFVATDYTCCPGVDSTKLDTYFIPDAALSDEFITCGIPADKLCPSGIPIRQEFYTRCDRKQAKENCGIDPTHKHIVMACGSMGCGPMEDLSERIAPERGDTMELTVICGTNEKLRENMEKIHGGNPRVHIRGFVKDMPLLLDSADVYVTKPGGLSVSEAMAKGAFMVLVNAVGGCESYNLQHLLRKGAAVTGATVDELTEVCLKAANAEKKITSCGTANAAKVIYETMKQRNEIHEAEQMASACAAGGLSQSKTEQSQTA